MAVKEVWHSSSVMNPIGNQARVLDFEGDKVIEISVAEKLPFFKRLRALWQILLGKRVVIAEVYMEDSDYEQRTEKKS